MRRSGRGLAEVKCRKSRAWPFRDSQLRWLNQPSGFPDPEFRNFLLGKARACDMPTKIFKANIYYVEVENYSLNPTTQFPESIITATGLSLPDREKRIRGTVRRIEHSARDRNVLFFVNFTIGNYEGHGTLRLGQPASYFRLASDQFFAPEAAMLYDEEFNIVYLESSMHMGPGLVASYFEEFANNGTHYNLVPVTDSEAAARARRQQTIRSVNLRFRMGQITDRDRASGIGPTRGFGNDLGAAYIDITISAENRKDSSLRLPGVFQMIENLTGQDMDGNSVSKFSLRGREHEDESLGFIDLIQHRESREVRVEIDPQTRRVPYRIRWDSLRRVRENYIR